MAEETQANQPEAVETEAKEETPTEPAKEIADWSHIEPGTVVRVHQRIKEITPKGDEAGGKTIYWCPQAGVVWRMDLPNGKPERIKANLLGVEGTFFFNPSWDGRELLIVTVRPSSKLVVIENVFR